MIWSIEIGNNMQRVLDKSGIGDIIYDSKNVLIKINLSSPPKANSPRTDPKLILEVVSYILERNASCTLVESANGYFYQNLECVGLGELIKEKQVEVIDLDCQEVEAVTINNELHYLPKCLKDFSVRIGIPSTSKRSGMLFSNNVKLFVGIVPRRMYQEGPLGYSRPRVHVNLHESIANIFRATMEYSPFHFFINGGKAIIEELGETMIDRIYVGDNPLELDFYFLDKFHIQVPEYIEKLIR